MSPEIDLLNTYPVCGQERTVTLYHVEIQKDWEGKDVEVEVYDVLPQVRIAMAMARLTMRAHAAAQMETGVPPSS
jgi:hypothetical protein